MSSPAKYKAFLFAFSGEEEHLTAQINNLSHKLQMRDTPGVTQGNFKDTYKNVNNKKPTAIEQGLNWNPRICWLRSLDKKGLEQDMDRHIQEIQGVAKEDPDEIKIIVYYAGRALLYPEEGSKWKWISKLQTGIGMYNTEITDGVCEDHLTMVDPEPLLESILQLPNDVLVLFNSPFELNRTVLRSPKSKADTSRPDRNVQLVAITEPTAYHKKPQGSYCVRFGCQSKRPVLIPDLHPWKKMPVEVITECFASQTFKEWFSVDALKMWLDSHLETEGGIEGGFVLSESIMGLASQFVLQKGASWKTPKN